MDFFDFRFWKVMGFRARKIQSVTCRMIKLIMNKKMLTLFLISAMTQQANAVTYTWNVGNGDWAVGTSWTPVGPPTIADNANVLNGGNPRTDTDSPTAMNLVMDNSSDLNFTNQNLTTQTAILGSTNGNTNVINTGRTWNNNTGAGSIVLGATGDCTLDFSNGSILNTTTAQVALNTGSQSQVTLRDSGTAWNNSGALQIGVSGNISNFSVDLGAALNCGSTEIGVNAGNNFTVDIHATGTNFTNTGALTVAVGRACNLQVRQGANLTAGSCILAQNSGSSTLVTLDTQGSSGTTFNCAGTFVIGQSGTATLNFLGNANASTGAATFGSAAGSSGTATMSNGSTWTSTGTMTIGNGGIGLFNMTSTCQVTVPNILMAVSNSGTLNITAANARLTTGSITGGAGVGSFTLSNGGILQASANSASFISGLTTATLTSAATIDSQAFTIVVPQNLTGNATVTKIGNGTLILTGTNTLSGTAVITTGTLQGNSANLPQAGITDNSILIFDQAASGTYASNITGSGSLVKQNVGTLVLTGTNSYAAGTVISAGTLQGNTTSIPATGGVVDNGILVFDQATNATFTGNITGTGSFVKQNAGTLILTGTNSYAAGTTITGGTLQGNTTSIPSGPVLNNSILVFDQAAAGVFSGNISGIGTLIKQNAGLLILSGMNTYTGNTVVTAGVLQGNSNSIPSGNVIDNATLVFDQAFDGTFGGTLSGTGTFIKQGSGKLQLTGNSVGFGSNTFVLGGNLNVNGILGGLITVANGGTLSGNGILGNVINNGLISPGNSIGTLQMNSFVNNPSGVYEAEINSMGQSDQLLVATTATLNGGTLVVSAAPGIYIKGTTYTIIEAAGGLAGQFASTVLPTNVMLGVSYLPTELILTVLATNLDTFGLSGNALRVAEYIRDHASADPDLLSVIAALNLLTPEQEQKALDQMHPALFEALALSAGDTAHMINTAFIDRLNFLRSTYDPCDPCPCIPNGNLWIGGAADFVRQSRSQGLRGFNASSEGVAIGYDNRIFNTVFAGVGLGYSHTNLHWENSAGRADINGFYAGTYATYDNQYFYLDATLLGFITNNRVRRHIEFAFIDRTAKHKHHNYGINPHLGLGLHMNYCTVNITPFADADYYYVQQNRFHEHGANSIDLHVKRNHSNLIRFEGGIKFARPFNFGDGFITPNASVSYVGHRLLSGKKYIGAFPVINADFAVFGSNELFNQVEIGAGVEYFINDSFAVNTWYDIELGDKRQEQEVNVEVSYSF